MIKDKVGQDTTIEDKTRQDKNLEGTLQATAWAASSTRGSTLLPVVISKSDD